MVFLLMTAGVSSGQTKYTFRLAYSTPENSQYDLLMRQFKAWIEERTAGQVNIVLIPAGAAGSEKENVEQLQLGILDMAITGIPSFVEPRLDLLAVPFVFKDIDHVNRCSAGIVGRRIAEWMSERDVIVLDYYGRLGTVVASTRPVKEPKDWQGLKVRISETEPFIDFYRGFGASPTALPFGEVYTALQTGVVDGVRTLLDLVYDSGFHEHAKYIVVTGDPSTPGFFQMSRRAFESLPEDLQTIFYQTAAELREVNNRWLQGKWDEYVEKLEKEGVEIFYYDSDLARETVKDLPAKYAKKYNAEDMLALIKSLE
jgi:tripartite ATP-independent transporter DctP family solute receptor